MTGPRHKGSYQDSLNTAGIKKNLSTILTLSLNIGYGCVQVTKPAKAIEAGVKGLRLECASVHTCKRSNECAPMNVLPRSLLMDMLVLTHNHCILFSLETNYPICTKSYIMYVECPI